MFCLLLIINSLANSLDPDQDQHSVGPDLDPNCVFLKEFLKKLKIIGLRQQKREKLPSMQRV